MDKGIGAEQLDAVASRVKKAQQAIDAVLALRNCEWLKKCDSATPEGVTMQNLLAVAANILAEIEDILTGDGIPF